MSAEFITLALAANEAEWLKNLMFKNTFLIKPNIISGNSIAQQLWVDVIIKCITIRFKKLLIGTA